MTEKLYYQNPKQMMFHANVLSCEQKGTNYQVILDQTCFYPEGGGQPCDLGIIQDIQVIDVQETKQGIVHTLQSAIEVGAYVVGEIDYSRRFLLSQQHTGEHIFSGIVHRLFGYDNVGFHMGKEYVTIDFNGVLSAEQIMLAEKMANEVVFQNVPVSVTYPTQKELEQIDYRSKKEIKEAIRIVEIPEADICACCGTHISYTGEIGPIKVTSSESFKGGVRLTLLIGKLALDDYQKKHEIVKNVMGLLSSKAEDVTSNVERLLNTITELKTAVQKAKEKEMEAFLLNIEEDQNVLQFVENYSMDDVRKLCDKLIQKAKLALVYTGNDQMGYSYVLGSKEMDVITLGKEINQVLNGRGGGKGTMTQGKLEASNDQIITYFNEMVH